jgi:hypothetical protein
VYEEVVAGECKINALEYPKGIVVELYAVKYPSNMQAITLLLASVIAKVPVILPDVFVAIPVRLAKTNILFDALDGVIDTDNPVSI